MNRYTPLAKEKAVTDQELDNAVQATSRQGQGQAARAGVETAKAAIVAAPKLQSRRPAAVATAKLNLGFTRIISPIDGIAGIAQAQVGNLVSPTSDTPDHGFDRRSDQGLFHPSEQEYLDFNRRNLLEANERR